MPFVAESRTHGPTRMHTELLQHGFGVPAGGVDGDAELLGDLT
jgi:hypothetical protein